MAIKGTSAWLQSAFITALALACYCLGPTALQACSRLILCVGRAWHSSSAATAVRVSLLRHSSCQPAMAPQCAQQSSLSLRRDKAGRLLRSSAAPTADAHG